MYMCYYLASLIQVKSTKYFCNVICLGGHGKTSIKSSQKYFAEFALPIITANDYSRRHFPVSGQKYDRTFVS